MAAQCVDLFTNAVSGCALWFFSIVNETGTYTLWLSCVFIFLVYKFLFRPIFGYASSDLARNSYNAFKRRKEE